MYIVLIQVTLKKPQSLFIFLANYFATDCSLALIETSLFFSVHIIVVTSICHYRHVFFCVSQAPIFLTVANCPDATLRVYFGQLYGVNRLR